MNSIVDLNLPGREQSDLVLFTPSRTAEKTSTADDFLNLAHTLNLIKHDFIIVADGSGKKADNSCGYYAEIFDVSTQQIFKVFGGCNRGTNNASELNPFVHSLWFLEQTTREQLRSKAVVCVSDSEVTIKCGRREYSRVANRSLWATIDYFEQEKKVQFDWRWIRRESHILQSICDGESRRIRKLMEKI